MSFITELLAFPKLINTYKNNYKIQRRFMENTIEKVMVDVMADNDGILSEKDLKKLERITVLLYLQYWEKVMPF